MAANCISTVTLSDLITCPTAFRLFCGTFDRGPELANIYLSLRYIPAFSGVIPNRRGITLSRGSEPKVTHFFFSSIKVSKSKASVEPLSSPAISAARRAAIFVS